MAAQELISQERELFFSADEGEAKASEIQAFFAGCSVLVTGGTGFMGQVLVEKLLRSCPGLGAVFLLARAKRGRGPAERVADVTGGQLFDRLRAERPKALAKVAVVEGDVGLPRLGLSDADAATLAREVHVVFHVAATVRFDEGLRRAVQVNVAGTSEMLGLARQMRNLKAVVHVSTAYSNCPLKAIDEIFYPVPMTKEKLVKLCDCLDDKQLDLLKPSLLGGWPNTYVFTKAVAEHVVQTEAVGLPAVVVRPSIVVSTAREPLRGWINNLYGATGVTAGASVGLIKTLHCDPDILADLVPADMAINCIIAAAWGVGRNRQRNEESPGVAEDEVAPPVLNFVSSPEQPITWGEYMKHSERGLAFPSTQCMWPYCLTLNKHRLLNTAYMWCLHLLPALLADIALLLTGREPRIWKTYRKVHKFTEVIERFTTHQWKFRNEGVQRLWQELPARDRHLFHFNMAELDWPETNYIAIRGIRMYLLKDPMETVPEARKRYNRLLFVHRALKYGALLVLGWLLYRLLSLVFL